MSIPNENMFYTTIIFSLIDIKKMAGPVVKIVIASSVVSVIVYAALAYGITDARADASPTLKTMRDYKFMIMMAVFVTVGGGAYFFLRRRTSAAVMG